MKKFIRFLVPFLLVIAILGSLAWYLFVYDRGFTQEMLLQAARHFETSGSHSAAAWFYDLAYKQSGYDDEVAIELSDRFKAIGNYTKAEYTLSNAIADGGTPELYIALCKTYVQQDKLLDAVEMLDKISNPQIKAQLDARRPPAPQASLEPGFYSQYYDVTVTAKSGRLYLTSDGSYPSIDQGSHPGTVTLPAGETTLKAVAVDDNGLVSPLSIYGYIVGGVIEEVKFADEVMEASIREILQVSEDSVIYTNDLWEIHEFTVPEDVAGYSDLKFLPYLTSLTITEGDFEDVSFLTDLQNLEKLSISDTPLSSQALEEIASLPQLSDLTLAGCGLSNISPLASAHKLVHLDLSRNAIRNLDPLEKLVSMETLALPHNALTSLKALSAMNSLQKLDVSFNALTSIAPVCASPALTYLDITNNKLSDLGAIGNLTSLTHFYAGHNSIADVSALAACTNLQELNISTNVVTDMDALSVLTALTHFDFSHNLVTSLPALPADCALTIFDGSYNALADISVMNGMENLNKVNLDHNEELTDITPLAECPVLVQVSAFGTKVADVTALTDHNIIVNYDPTINDEAPEE